MKQGTLILLLISLWTLAGCDALRTRTEYVPLKVESVRYREIPDGLLRRHCADLKLGDIVTKADVEEALATSWLCIQGHNRDKDDIEALK